jgi:catechol 2,3-dioxygenase-like lactoylglutathione lyase family enzyme
MSLAHFTLATQHVERTAAFFERTLGYSRNPRPGNSPVDACWLDIGRGQEMHVLYVEGFAASPFEREFGRHVAVFHPLADFPALKARLTREGAELIEPLRATPFERFFFREPVNGYVFEVVDAARAPSAR